ncbi:hypothetical protein FRC04_002463 [Tulasnella sp. 424]|nr:hypothetical protein FRC04_002463 [Tulasnella sp. 424]
MADFAATCMAQDALRWWGSLEEEIQQSWKLLQKEMLLAYPPMFHGKSGEEAEKFVQMVYRRARDARRQGDSRWIVEFVQTCLAAEALRWYATLEPDVQDNWRLLQQAILNRWPGDGNTQLAITGSSIFPTPAAAAPPIVPAPRQKGRIRIAREGDRMTYYLSNTLSLYGFSTLVTNRAQALVVELEPTPAGLWKLCIADGQSIEYESLAIWWIGLTTEKFVTLPAFMFSEV